MNKIKVLEVLDSIQYGGVEQVLYNYISNLDKNKYDFTVVTTGKRYYDAEEKYKKIGVKIFGLPLKKQNFIKYLYLLNKIIKDGQFDVVHAHVNYWGFISLFIAKNRGVKTRIAHVHGIFKKNLIIKVFSYFTIKNSTIRLACSIQAGKSIYGNLNFDVLANGVDVKKFKYESNVRKKIREKYKICEDDFVVGHVGRFYEVKNHFFIIRLFFEFLKINKKAKLMLVGSGTLLDDVKVMVRNLKIEDNVIFLGSVKKIYEIYNAFDVFVLPSISEGFGMVVLEAQCNGLKCIVSSGVPREIAITNNVVFLPLDDNDRWLSELKKYSVNNSRNSFCDVISKKGYDIRTNNKKLEKIYEKGD